MVHGHVDFNPMQQMGYRAVGDGDRVRKHDSWWRQSYFDVVAE
jgi:hypothetical protein